MSRSIRISERSARDMLVLLEMAGVRAKSVSELRLALEPKRSTLLNAKRVRSKKATKRQETSAIRAAVMARANLVCECGCFRWFRGFNGAAQMDHFEGRARSESVETCWALRADCHQAKTLNHPSAKEWLWKFIVHAEAHGYADEANRARRRAEAIELMEQAQRAGAK